MKCVTGIDLGSTTTKAIMLNEKGEIVGKGITNSRSNYEVACEAARQEALTSAKFNMIKKHTEKANDALASAFKLELYLRELDRLEKIITKNAKIKITTNTEKVENLISAIIKEMKIESESGFLSKDANSCEKKSDFFRDLAGESFIKFSDKLSKKSEISFDVLVGLYDKSIIEIETTIQKQDFTTIAKKATKRLNEMGKIGIQENAKLNEIIEIVSKIEIKEQSFVGTGYGRQTLPFPKKAIRSEILCHGKGAHAFYPETKTVLDIGGQDTKSIQVDKNGVVTSFQMNDRCAAGCGRYLGYIADELKIGLHELGPLAMKADKVARVNSTCTVFAGAELRERLALGQKIENILAGLHKAIIMKAMSLLARSGGIENELTFTGGVCNNIMAVEILKKLIKEHYSKPIKINIHSDSIYTGAYGAALFSLEDLKNNQTNMLPVFTK